MRPYLPAVDLLPRHPPCVFPLHWRAFRQRADIWFRSPNFSGKTVYFSVRFPHFCHRFAVHFPYDCRPFSIIALPLDSAVLGASARKSQWFQKSSGSLPYVFHTFSMLFPSTCHTFSVRYLTEQWTKNIQTAAIFRETPSFPDCVPSLPPFQPHDWGKARGMSGYNFRSIKDKTLSCEGYPYGEKIEERGGWLGTAQYSLPTTILAPNQCVPSKYAAFYRFSSMKLRMA